MVTKKRYVRCEARLSSGLRCEKSGYDGHELHQASAGRIKKIWSGAAAAVGLDGHNFIELMDMGPDEVKLIKLVNLKTDYDEIDFKDGDLAVYFPGKLAGQIKIKA
jgi:hypothetical protein